MIFASGEAIRLSRDTLPYSIVNILHHTQASVIQACLTINIPHQTLAPKI